MAERDHLRVVDGGRHEGPNAYELRTYDEPAEQAVLAYLVQDAEPLLELGFLRTEHFRSKAHSRVFEAIVALSGRNEAVDAVSVLSELRASGRLGEVGGAEYLTDLLNRAPVLGLSHLLTHARRVRDLAVRRRLFALSVELRSRVENDSADEATLVGHARACLDVLGDDLGASEQATRVDAVATRMLAELDALSSQPGEGSRATGFAKLDATVAGLHNELVIVGARPGMGKTAIACAIAENVARGATGVFVASLETAQEMLLLRMTCARAGLEVHRARVGALSDDAWSRFVSATGDSRVAAALDRRRPGDDGARALGQVPADTSAARARGAQARPGRRRLRAAPPSSSARHEARGGGRRECARAEGYGAGARRHGARPGSAQSRRGQAGRQAPPALGPARVGELEQCARTVLLLYREDYYGAKRREYRPTGVVEINVAKQNNGPTGVVRVRFEAQSTRFSSLPEDGAIESHAQGCRCPVCVDRSLIPPGYQP